MALNKKLFKVPKTDQEELSIAIVDTPCRAEGLSLTTWSSAGILSNLLHKLAITFPPSQQNVYTILELGAGTGLSGLAAACVWGQGALLTDLPAIVPGVQANIRLNAATLRAHGASAACATLDWHAPDAVHLDAAAPAARGRGRRRSLPPVAAAAAGAAGFPVVLAADTMYAEEHPRLLSRAIRRWLRRSAGARAVVVYAMRVAYVDHMRAFWELMEAGGLVADQQGREEIDLAEWDDEKLHEWSVWKWKDL